MIIFNEKEYQGKHTIHDSMLLVINTPLSLEELYDKLRKGEDISPEEVQIHAYINGDGRVALDNDNMDEHSLVGGVFVGKNAILNEDQLEDLAEFDKSGIFQREPLFAAYEKSQFGQGLEGFDIKLFNFDHTKAQHKEVLRRHIALSQGAMPTIYSNLDLSLVELKKYSASGEKLYRDFGKGSVAKDNPLPTLEEIKEYDSMNEYEKRLIGLNLVHPSKVLELKKALSGERGNTTITNDLYRKLAFFKGDVKKTVDARLANVNNDLLEKFDVEFKKSYPRSPMVLAEFIQGCRDLYKLEKEDFTDEKIEELVKGFDLKRMQAVVSQIGDKKVTVATSKNPSLIALSRELNMTEIPQQLLRAMSVYIDQNNANDLYQKGIVEWIKANKRTSVADFIEMLNAKDIIRYFDPNKKAKDLIKSLDDELGKRDAELFGRKYRYDPSKNEIAIKGRHLVVEDGPYKMYMLSADDPRNFVSGYDTCCCQRWDDGNYHAGGKEYKIRVLNSEPTSSDNAGGSCVWKLTSDPFAANVVIEKDGEIVGQSFVWVDALKDIFVFDNIEYANDAKSTKYANIIGLYAKHIPYSNVHLGMGCNGNQKLNGVGDAVKEEAHMPKTLSNGYVYTDYHKGSAKVLKKYDGRKKESVMVRFPLDESRCRIRTEEDEPTKWDALTTDAFSFMLNDYQTPIEERLNMVERFKNNPDEALQRQVVMRDPRAILAIDNPSEEIQMYVWEKMPDIAKEIKNPCLALQVAILEKDPNYLKKCTDVSEEVICEVLSKNGLLLSNVPMEKRTPSVCEIALRNNGYAWNYIPTENRSSELAAVAVETSPKMISLIEEEYATPENQLIAARKDPTVILLMECTVQSQMAAVSRRPDLVLQLKNPALPVVRVSVQKSPNLIGKYQHAFPSLRREAIEKNPFVAKELVNLTQEEYDLAISLNNRVSRFIGNPSDRPQEQSTVQRAVAFENIEIPSDLEIE